MPVFDTITVNHGHIAKVLVVRHNSPSPTDDEICGIDNFLRWMNYIRKEVKKNSIVTTNYEHILN